MTSELFVLQAYTEISEVNSLKDQNLRPEASKSTCRVTVETYRAQDSQITNEKQSLVKVASSAAVQWQGPRGVDSQGEHHSSSSDASEGVERGL